MSTLDNVTDWRPDEHFIPGRVYVDIKGRALCQRVLLGVLCDSDSQRLRLPIPTHNLVSKPRGNLTKKSRQNKAFLKYVKETILWKSSVLRGKVIKTVLF